MIMMMIIIAILQHGPGDHGRRPALGPHAAGLGYRICIYVCVYIYIYVADDWGQHFSNTNM